MRDGRGRGRGGDGGDVATAAAASAEARGPWRQGEADAAAVHVLVLHALAGALRRVLAAEADDGGARGHAQHLAAAVVGQAAQPGAHALPVAVGGEIVHIEEVQTGLGEEREKVCGGETDNGARDLGFGISSFMVRLEMKANAVRKAGNRSPAQCGDKAQAEYFGGLQEVVFKCKGLNMQA